MIGTKVGPYEVTAKLGEGGMGEVFRAADPRLGREVAIKVLPTELTADPERLRRFEQEARAASALNHPNVLTVFDVGSHDGAPYLVTEVLEGRTLRDRLADGEPVTHEQALDWAAQVARGLRAAHERGIVHRDLKPENLFLCRDGRVKILDFGLAKLVGTEQSAASLAAATTLVEKTSEGTLVGTVGYMAPEQVRAGEVDHRADLFSLGCVLYELATGRRAFRRETKVETLTAILREQPEELAAGGSTTLDPALARLLERLLEKDPERRFQSAGDLAYNFEELAGRKGATALASGRIASAVRWPLVAAAALVLLGGALWLARDRFFGSSAATPPIASLAVLPLEDFARDEGQAYFADGMTEALIAELAQISALRVISRTSVMRFKGTEQALPEIARELGVDVLVEGSVLRSGDRVRINAQLVHGTTDRHLWARSYERDVRDVLALQSEIAREIAREIRVRVTPEEESRLAASRPVDPAAHEAYLKGRYLFFDQLATQELLARAREQYQRAVELDPGYAPAWAGLADCWRSLALNGSPREQAEPAAREAGRRAIESDEGSPEAHVAQGAVLVYFDWDLEAGIRHFRRALELSPGYAVAHHRLAFAIGLLGRTEESLATARTALALDPLDARTRANVVRQLALLGRLAEARAELSVHADLARDRGQRLDAQLSLAEGNLERAIELARANDMLGTLASALVKSGRADEAAALLPEIEARIRAGRTPRETLPLALVALGRNDDAFRELDAAFDEHAAFLIELHINSGWDPVRSDPRFAALVARVGLPEREGR